MHDITALAQHTRSNDDGRGTTSPPLDSTHGRTTSGMARHHRPWAAHTIERRRAWHAIIAIRKHTRSNDVGRDMPSPPLDNTLSRTTFNVASHHCGWAAHTIERRRAWHEITSLGMHAWSDDVGRCITSPPFDSTSVRNIGRGMKSPPFDSTHGRTTLGMTFHHHLWAAHTVKRCWVWHDITAFG